MKNGATSNDIYNLLEQVRRRPGMFFGRSGTLPLLDAFLTGMRMQTLKPEDPSFADFNTWLAARIEELSDSHNYVLRWLEEELGPEKAFDAYFEYLDEFRANHVELLYVNADPLEPKFTRADGTAPGPPNRLVVGRFCPSEIYFWGCQFGLTLEKKFHFCHSAAEAKKLAAREWSTPPRSWKKLMQPERLRRAATTGLWGLVEQVRQRPGMYCDPGNKPLSTLETMLWGYGVALRDHRVPDEGRGFNEAFRGYLRVRFGWSTSCGWAVAIRDHLKTGEDELAKFFVVVAEFKEVVDADDDDLPRLARRLEVIAHRMDGFRQRRREWVVQQIREDREAAPYR